MVSMKQIRIVAALSLLSLMGSALSFGGTPQGEKPAPATELMNQAKAQAEREKKAIFVVFDASW